MNRLDRRPAGAVLLAVLAVALTASVARIAALNASTTAFLFLLVVLFSATMGGLAAGIAASVLSTTALNYFFLPPLHTFHVADPENWAALGAFLVVATVASRLVTRARDQAERAGARAREVQTLYDLSVQMFLAESSDEALADAAVRALEATGAGSAGVVLLPPEGPREVAWIGSAADGTVRERIGSIPVHRQTLEFPDGRARDLYVPLDAGGEPPGVLVALRTTATRAAVESIARLLGLARERERLLVQRAHVEALRESESMKTALLRAVSHDLSTPLTAITVQVASLNRQLAGLPAGKTVSLLAEEVARFRRRIDNLLAMARLETGSIAPRPEPIPPPDLFRGARENLGAPSFPGDFTIRVEPECPDVFADPSLALEIIVNLVENARRASPAEAGVELVAGLHPSDSSQVRLGVLDRGRGIGEGAQPGGLGLEIARRFARASGGALELTARDGGGTCAWIDLPAASPDREGAVAETAHPRR